MRVAVVIPSIRKFEHWDLYKRQMDELKQHNFDVFVVGEDKNNSGIEECTFIGREEVNATGLTSLRGVDVAFAKIYKNGYGAVIMFDDDTKPMPGFFETHLTILGSKHKYTKDYTNPLVGEYARGIPFYDRYEGEIVLHQGLWTKDGDFFVVDKMQDIRYRPHEWGIAPIGKAITISSMNVCFNPKIIPAYPQIPLRRFDDIWSGLILKRITDHLGDLVSFGIPFVEHTQAPRNIMNDLKFEQKGFPVNERLWAQLQNFEFSFDDYKSCIRELVFDFKFPFQEYLKEWYLYVSKI